MVQISKAAFVLCAAPDFPAASARELIANIKQNPDKYTYGHEGVGGMLHLGAERIFAALGLAVRACDATTSAVESGRTVSGIR